MSEKERYSLYLCSREWGVKRQAVRERCGGLCERCKAAPMSHVHHLTYARKYDERLDDLAGYCEPCHEFTHGLRADDPILSAPVKLFGFTIRTVYLAGRITGPAGAWRREIMPHWGDHDKHARDAGHADSPGVDTARIPDGRGLAYCGPFWRTPDGLGHGPGFGPHLLADDYDYDTSDDGSLSAAISDPLSVANEIRNWISLADLVFAWIDSREAYGTLVEIGYASGRHKSIVVASPYMDRELWLSAAFAHRFIRAYSAGEAWAKLWSGPDPLDGVREVVDLNTGVW